MKIIIFMVLFGYVGSLSIANRREFIIKSLVVSAGGKLVMNPMQALAEDDDFVIAESGLKYKVIKEGTGEPPEIGDTVKIKYTGWLDKFDSETKFDMKAPLSFQVGAGEVIRGFDESFSGMLTGERRQIIVPPRLAYGDRGVAGVIPGGASICFDIELLGISKLSKI
mmetsp:Transcript_514/g.773  ORF Transcript_514/g.773 Transcript_514/m.773 type:complete len:167 (+) Transcript_514:80-580(+)